MMVHECNKQTDRQTTVHVIYLHKNRHTQRHVDMMSDIGATNVTDRQTRCMIAGRACIA